MINNLTEEELKKIKEAVSDAIQFAREKQDDNPEYKKKKEDYMQLYERLTR